MQRLAAIAVTILALMTPALAQDTLHVTATRQATINDAQARKMVGTIVEGVIGARHYTCDSMAVFGGVQFEVGQDYPVVKADDKHIHVRVTNKHGRDVTWTLTVLRIEEVAK